MKDNVFLILGGDDRSLYLGEYLEKQGLKVCYYAFNQTDCFSTLKDAISEASCIILPLPLSRDKATLNAPLFDGTVLLSDICAIASPDKSFFGGQLPVSFCEALRDKGAFYCDYLLLEELAIYNAIPTAEGIIRVLIESLPITIHGMRCGITGYGKIGKVIALTLLNLGAEVTIFARKESDLADAYTKGIRTKSYEDFTKEYFDFDALINTVPVRVIGERELSSINPECVLIEAASSPFGIDFQAAREKAMEVIKASSLPGKVAPKTAGEIIGRSILPILKSRGLTD